MPLFDYRCENCRKRFSLLIGVVAEQQVEKCPSCGSTSVHKLISRFGRLRSEDDLIDDLADPSKIGDMEDPKDLQRWMRSLGKEMGEDLGDDFDEMVDEIGSPESEESAMGESAE